MTSKQADGDAKPREGREIVGGSRAKLKNQSWCVEE